MLHADRMWEKSIARFLVIILFVINLNLHANKNCDINALDFSNKVFNLVNRQQDLIMCDLSCDLAYYSTIFNENLDTHYYFYRDLLYRVGLHFAEENNQEFFIGISGPNTSWNRFVDNILFKHNIASTTQFNESYYQLFKTEDRLVTTTKNIQSFATKGELLNKFQPFLKLINEFYSKSNNNSQMISVLLNYSVSDVARRAALDAFSDFLMNRPDKLSTEILEKINNDSNYDLIEYFSPSNSERKVIPSKLLAYVPNTENTITQGNMAKVIEDIKKSIRDDKHGVRISILHRGYQQLQMPANGIIFSKRDFVKDMRRPGDHMMLIVGYAEHNGDTYFKILNSWDEWGQDGGYAIMRADLEIFKILGMKFYL
jgi:hypothetical protein